MQIASTFSLFLIAFLNAASPGPGVIIVSGIAAQFGGMAASIMILGMLAGTSLLLGLAVGSTFGVLSIGPEAYAVMRWSGVILLALLAWLLWPKRPEALDGFTGLAQRSHFWTGAALSLSQPMSLLFLLAVVPQFVKFEGSSMLGIGSVAGAVLLGTGLAMGMAAALGSVLRLWLERVQVTFAKVAATSLALFALSFALSNLGVLDALSLSGDASLTARGKNG